MTKLIDSAMDSKVELLADGTSYVGIVENISEKGLYMIVNPSKTSIDFTSRVKLELKFQLPSGESLNLPCQVKWSYKTPPHGLTYSMGMEILKQSPEYIEFISTLN
jgi:hypothetical protein